MSWTEERVSVLRQLWGNGKSASEIAEILGGVTRNAVIGKAHRLGLSGRPSPIRKPAPKPRAAKAQRPKPAARVAPRGAVKPTTAPAPRPVYAVPPPAPEVDDAPPGGATILDLNERMCRWPHGDPRQPGFKFCGRSAAPGLPYCAHHAAQAYQAPKSRREEANEPMPAKQTA